MFGQDIPGGATTLTTSPTDGTMGTLLAAATLTETMAPLLVLALGKTSNTAVTAGITATSTAVTGVSPTLVSNAIYPVSGAGIPTGASIMIDSTGANGTLSSPATVTNAAAKLTVVQPNPTGTGVEIDFGVAAQNTGSCVGLHLGAMGGWGNDSPYVNLTSEGFGFPAPYFGVSLGVNNELDGTTPTSIATVACGYSSGLTAVTGITPALAASTTYAAAGTGIAIGATLVTGADGSSGTLSPAASATGYGLTVFPAVACSYGASTAVSGIAPGLAGNATYSAAGVGVTAGTTLLTDASGANGTLSAAASAGGSSLAVLPFAGCSYTGGLTAVTGISPALAANTLYSAVGTGLGPGTTLMTGAGGTSGTLSPATGSTGSGVTMSLAVTAGSTTVTGITPALAPFQTYNVAGAAVPSGTTIRTTDSTGQTATLSHPALGNASALVISQIPDQGTTVACAYSTGASPVSGIYPALPASTTFTATGAGIPTGTTLTTGATGTAGTLSQAATVAGSGVSISVLCSYGGTSVSGITPALEGSATYSVSGAGIPLGAMMTTGATGTTGTLTASASSGNSLSAVVACSYASGSASVTGITPALAANTPYSVAGTGIPATTQLATSGGGTAGMLSQAAGLSGVTAAVACSFTGGSSAVTGITPALAASATYAVSGAGIPSNTFITTGASSGATGTLSQPATASGILLSAVVACSYGSGSTSVTAITPALPASTMYAVSGTGIPAGATMTTGATGTTGTFSAAPTLLTASLTTASVLLLSGTIEAGSYAGVPAVGPATPGSFVYGGNSYEYTGVSYSPGTTELTTLLTGVSLWTNYGSGSYVSGQTIPPGVTVAIGTQPLWSTGSAFYVENSVMCNTAIDVSHGIFTNEAISIPVNTTVDGGTNGLRTTAKGGLTPAAGGLTAASGSAGIYFYSADTSTVPYGINFHQGAGQQFVDRTGTLIYGGTGSYLVGADLSQGIFGRAAVRVPVNTALTAPGLEVTAKGGGVAAIAGVAFDSADTSTGLYGLQFVGSLLAPSGLTATPQVSGGIFAAGAYYCKITALNGNGETVGSSEASATLAANGSCALSWNPVLGSTGYKIYRAAMPNGESGATSLAATIASGATTSYTDTGATTTTGSVPTTNLTARQFVATTGTLIDGGTSSYGIGLDLSQATFAHSAVHVAVSTATLAPAIQLTATSGTMAAAPGIKFDSVGGTSLYGIEFINGILPPPTGVTAAPQTTGGSFTAGAYYWQITTLNATGETIGSQEVHATIAAAGSCVLSWNAVPGATAYNVYRGTASGGETQVPALSGVSGTTCTDTGAAAGGGSVPASTTAEQWFVDPAGNLINVSSGTYKKGRALAGGTFSDSAIDLGDNNVRLGTVNGVKIGLNPTELLGLWGATPVPQQAGAAYTTVNGPGQIISTGGTNLIVASNAGFILGGGTCTVAGVTGTVTYTGLSGTTILVGCTIASGSYTATNGGAVFATGVTAGFVAGVAATVKSDSTFDGGRGPTSYTISDAIGALKTCGMLKA